MRAKGGEEDERKEHLTVQKTGSYNKGNTETKLQANKKEQTGDSVEHTNNNTLKDKLRPSSGASDVVAKAHMILAQGWTYRIHR